MPSLRSHLVDAVREEVRPAPLRLLEAFLDISPAAAQTLDADELTAPKAMVLARLAQREAAPELTPETLRQRILELNRAAAKGRDPASLVFLLKSEKTTLRLTLDPKSGRDRADAITRKQLKASLIEDTPASDSAILQAPRATTPYVVQVFISHAWETPDVERILDKFLEKLRFEVSNLPPDRAYRIKLWFDRWDLGTIPPTFDAQTVPAARASRIAIFCLSNKWYASAACKAEAKVFRSETGDYDHRIVRLQLTGRRQDGDPKLVSGPVLPEFYCQNNPQSTPPDAANLIQFCDRASPAQQIELAAYVCRQIMDFIEKLPPDPPSPPSPDAPLPLDDLGQKLARHAGQIDEHDVLVRERQALPPRASRDEESANAQELLPVLEHWARGETAEAPARNRVCVLLGSFGSGKTIATQMFARRLHELREAGETVPFPLYLDFRRLIPKIPRDGEIPPLQELIASSLSDKVGPIDGQMVLRIVRSMPCLILFDGLDEVGTALGVEKTARLYRQLLEIVPRAAWNEDAEHKAAQWAACPIRIMVTCRTHFFRNVIQQRTVFAEYSRQSAQPALAAPELQQTYFMAPFTPGQVQGFFIASLGDQKGRELFAAIGRIAKLEELASKPVMTRFVAELSDDLMADHAAGREINAATLYGHLFNKALERDGEKEMALEVRHQQHLLEDLAIHLWKGNATSLQVAEMETWFDRYILANPELTHLSLNAATPVKRLQTELRNASLLVRRNDDEFCFVHTSFFEYFLAMALKNRVTTGALPALPQEAAVNKETQHFLLDCTARDGDVGALGLAFGSLLRVKADLATRQFAWDMLALGRARGFDWPVPRHAHCAGLDIRDQTIAPANGAAEIVFDGVDFAGTNFLGSAISRAAFLQCCLEGAILSNALLEQCRFTACTGAPIGAAMARLNNSTVDAPTREAALRDVLFSFPPAQPAMLSGSVLRVPRTPRHLRSGVFSQDGACILIASDDGSMHLFDRASGCEIANYHGHDKRVNSAVLSPDGSCVLTASDDCTARLFDRASGREISCYQGHHYRVTSAVFSPDGSSVLTASDDHSVRLFDRASEREIARYQGHVGPVYSAVFSPDGACILTASDDGTARVFDRASEREIARYLGHRDVIHSAVFSPDGACVLTASGNNTAQLFDRVSEREIARYEGDVAGMICAVFSPDGGACVLIIGYDGAVLLDRMLRREIARYQNVWTKAVFSPDGACMLTVDNRAACLLDCASGREVARYQDRKGIVSSVVFSQDAAWLLIATAYGPARLFDCASGREMVCYEGHRDWMASAVFSPDDACVLTASRGAVRLFDRASGREIARYQGHDDVSSAVFSPDGACVLTASRDGTARLFDRASCQEIARYQGPKDMRSAVFSPDGACVLTASGLSAAAHLFDRASGREIGGFQGHVAGVNSAVFSPDGTWVLTTSGDQTARLFDRASEREIACYRGHKDKVITAVFSPNGAYVLTAYVDGTARLFDRVSEREIISYRGNRGLANRAVFSPDGAFVLMASANGTVRLFDRDTARCLRQIVVFPDDYAVCDPDGTVLSTGPNGWKYLHALTTVPGELPRVCCPDHVPIHVSVPLIPICG